MELSSKKEQEQWFAVVLAALNTVKSTNPRHRILPNEVTDYAVGIADGVMEANRERIAAAGPYKVNTAKPAPPPPDSITEI